MALRERLNYLRQEQNAIRGLLVNMRAAIELCASTDFSQRHEGLGKLQSLDHTLGGVVEHCHSEDRLIESITLHHYAPKRAYLRVCAEHEELIRLIQTYRQELGLATIDLMNGLIPAAKELMNRLESHIHYENGLLANIASSGVRSPRRDERKQAEASLARPSRSRTTFVTRHAGRAKPRVGQQAALRNYLIERHPELGC